MLSAMAETSARMLSSASRGELARTADTTSARSPRSWANSGDGAGWLSVSSFCVRPASSRRTRSSADAVASGIPEAAKPSPSSASLARISSSRSHPRDAVGLRGLGGRLLFRVDPVRQRREAMLEVGKRGGERGRDRTFAGLLVEQIEAGLDGRERPADDAGCSLPAVECCWMASILAVTSASASRTASEARSCAVATPTISSRIVVSVRSTQSIRACIAAAVLPSTASARRRPSRTAVSTRDARWAVGSFGEGGGLAGLRLAMRRDRRSSGEPGAHILRRSRRRSRYRTWRLGRCRFVLRARDDGIQPFAQRHPGAARGFLGRLAGIGTAAFHAPGYPLLH